MAGGTPAAETSGGALAVARLERLFDDALAARALLAGVELDIFTLLEGRALDAEAVAGLAKASPRGVAPLLEALAAEGLLARDAAGRFRLVPASAPLSRRSPDWRGAIAFRENGLSLRLAGLADAVRSGEPPATPPREPQALVAEVLARWQEDREHAEGAAAILEPPGKRRLIALGGAPGTLIPPLLARHPEARAVLLDHPIALDVARKLMPKDLVASGRVTFRAGNLLEDMPPAGFDMALVSDQATRLAPVEVRRVLTRAHAALVEGGTLAVRDRVRCKAPQAMAAADSGRLAAMDRARIADPRDAARRDALAALRLLVTAPGAGLHERAEYERWSVDAGFHRLRWRASADDLERAILIAERAPSQAVSALGA